MKIDDPVRSETGNNQVQQFFTHYGIYPPIPFLQTLDNTEQDNYSFWSNHLRDFRFGVPLTRAVSEFTFHEGELLGIPGQSIRRISVIEEAAPNKNKSGDVVILHRLPNNRLFVFVGDGLTPADTPPEDFNPLLNKYHCLDTPDAFIGTLLKDADFASKLFNEFDQNENSHPSRFFVVLEERLKNLYAENGISENLLQLTPNSKLPSIIGVACILGGPQIEIASIGDPVCLAREATQVIQSPLLPQNIGFDAETRSEINRIIKTHPTAKTVSDARRTEELKDWLINTYNAKINTPTGVTVVNGKNLYREGISYSGFSAGGIDGLLLATDGFILGTRSPSQTFREFASTTGARDLNLFLEKRQRAQPPGYDDHACLQEKPHDDITAVHIEFDNMLRGTELSDRFLNPQMEDVIPEMLLPWQIRAIQLTKEGFNQAEIAKRLTEEHYEVGPYTKQRYSLGTILKHLSHFLDIYQSFDPHQMREQIAEIEKILPDPKEALIYRLHSWFSYGWTHEKIVAHINELFQVSFERNRIQKIISIAERKVRFSRQQ